MKRVGLIVIKLAISIGILVYLIMHAQEGLQALHDKPKNWTLLLVATGLCLSMVITTFLRWWLLVRTLDLPFTIRDSLRLGFLGYLFNFISFGSVGGDLFKAVFIAREQPTRRPEAVATVFIDRLIGLYALFLLSGIGMLVTGQLQSENAQIQIVARAVLIATAVGTVCILLLLVPGFTGGWASEAVSNVPKIGPILFKLIGAVRLYRRRISNVLLAGIMSLGVHSLTTLCMYCIGLGLSCDAPPLATLFCIVPIAMLMGVLPLPLGALGAIEGAMEFLYINADPGIPAGTGMIVALGFRVATLVVAIIGFCYYLSNRSTVAKIMQEADGAEIPGVMHAREISAADGSKTAGDSPQRMVGDSCHHPMDSRHPAVTPRG